MYVPFETRFFTLGVDDKILQSTGFYNDEEYEAIYPFISNNMPEMFSINLREQIIQFGTTRPPQFNISVQEVIDLACYYYSDTDSIRAVTDEFVDDQALAVIRLQLTKTHADPRTVERILHSQIEMLGEAIKDVISVVISTLSRFGVAAVEDFGSVYRLTNIDDIGNAFFQLQSPDIVTALIQENTKLNLKPPVMI